MKLYGSFTSPFVRHCRIALIESGLRHELIETDYAASARLSPAARVPFLRDGDRLLTDSASILRHVREASGNSFCVNIDDFDMFLLASAGLESAVNIFLLERDGLGPQQSPYLGRQKQRVEDVLAALETAVSLPDKSLEQSPPYSDSLLRTGCFLSWGLFRQRFDIDHHPRLQSLVQTLDDYPVFAGTHPSLTA